MDGASSAGVNRGVDESVEEVAITLVDQIGEDFECGSQR